MKAFHLQRAPTHPGEILLEEFMRPLGLTQSRLAKLLQVSFRTINEIVKARRGVSPDMALRFSRYFRTTPELWLNLQVDYDLYQVRQKSSELLSAIKPRKLSEAA